MQETKISVKKVMIKKILLGIILSVTFLFGWLGVSIFLSPKETIKIITLKQENDQSITSAVVPLLRVGCYNIAHGRGCELGASNWTRGTKNDHLNHLKQIGKLLKDQNLDIVVLNEVDFESFWSDHIDQAIVIAHEAAYPYILEQRNVDLSVPFFCLKYGNAVLSKYPISDATFLNYPNIFTLAKLIENGLKKGVICTVHLPDNNELRVVAVHLSVNNENTRVDSAQMIIEHQNQSLIPLLIMGDFNTAPKSYPEYYTDNDGKNSVEMLLAHNQLSTILPALPLSPKDLTYPSEKPDCVIDWIFVSSPWYMEQQSVIKSKLSDHFPVVAVLGRENESQKYFSSK